MRRLGGLPNAPLRQLGRDGRDGLRARLEALEGCCLDSPGGGVGEGLAREMLAVLRRPMEVPGGAGAGS